VRLVRPARPVHLRHLPFWSLACLSAAVNAQSLEVIPAQGIVYMIAGPGGNTTVQAGEEAVVLVDTQTPEVGAALLGEIQALSAKPIRHIINTSADAHHTGNNELLSRAGTYVRLMTTFDPRGLSSDAAIVAHVNVLMRMSSSGERGIAIPAAAWPSDTYFTDSWEFYVNNEAVRLLHVAEAHTDGDTIVFFRRSDVVSTGDIYNTDRYPSFDVARGGIDGIIEGLNVIVDLTIPGENQHGGTVVIPGHGRLSDETEVVNYRDMVTIVRDRIQAMINEGSSLRQVQAARPTLDYDGIYDSGADGAWTSEEFVAAIYANLKGAVR
jgi:cyclase